MSTTIHPAVAQGADLMGKPVRDRITKLEGLVTAISFTCTFKAMAYVEPVNSYRRAGFWAELDRLSVTNRHVAPEALALYAQEGAIEIDRVAAWQSCCAALLGAQRRELVTRNVGRVSAVCFYATSSVRAAIEFAHEGEPMVRWYDLPRLEPVEAAQ